MFTYQRAERSSQFSSYVADMFIRIFDAAASFVSGADTATQPASLGYAFVSDLSSSAPLLAWQRHNLIVWHETEIWTL